MISNIKWAKTLQFRHVVNRVKYNQTRDFATLTFCGTVKLHGRNLAIRRENGIFRLHGRHGFFNKSCKNDSRCLQWFEQHWQSQTFRSQLTSMFNSISSNNEDVVTIYGEFVGPGFSPKVAINNLPTNHWFIFGAKCNDTEVTNTSNLTLMSNNDINNVLQYPTFIQVIDFNQNLEHIASQLETLTLHVEQQCPISESFGLKGLGEGIVWTCVEHPTNSKLRFKIKGNKHLGGIKLTSTKVVINPEVLETINEFVDHVLPLERLQQGLREVPTTANIHLGKYLKWINQDILTEEFDTLHTNNLIWKDVNKQITHKARQFFQSQNK